MNPQANKHVVREYVALFNAGNFQEIEKLFAPDAVIHGVLGKGGLEIARPVWQELHDAFGLNLEIVDLVAEGDTVAARYVESGTMKAPFRGLAATGKSFTMTAMEFFHFQDGKIKDRWGARDSGTMMRQLGLEK